MCHNEWEVSDTNRFVPCMHFVFKNDRIMEIHIFNNLGSVWVLNMLMGYFLFSFVSKMMLVLSFDASFTILLSLFVNNSNI